MDENLKHIQQIFETYKNTKIRTPEYQQKVLDDAYNTYKKTGEFGLWALIFASDPFMCRAFVVMGVKIQAENSLTDYNKEPHPILLDSISTLAYITSKTDEIFDIEKANVWRNVFAGVKEFSTAFDKELKHWDEWKKTQTAKDKIQYPYLYETELAKPVDRFSISVPILIRNSFERIDNNNLDKVDVLINKMIENFNTFQLESYMNLDHFIQKSFLELSCEKWVFTFETSKIVTDDEKQKTLEQLKGQLSDGWGSSMDQTERLIGDELLSISFDYSKAKINPQPALKNRMKI